jgi:hypothetical protein
MVTQSTSGFVNTSRSKMGFWRGAHCPIGGLLPLQFSEQGITVWRGESVLYKSEVGLPSNHFTLGALLIVRSWFPGHSIYLAYNP